MPTYDYECAKCGTFELFQSMKDDALKVCPHCKGKKITRLIGTGAGIIFKGSGFYETDYRSESYKKGKASAESKKSAKAGGSGSDSKKDGGTKKSASGDKSPAKKSKAKKKSD